MQRFAQVLLLPLLAALAACTNDAASWQIDGKEHSLSLTREQRWIWNSKFDLHIVATRMPECQRRHPLAPAGAQAVVEIYRTSPTDFILKQGTRLYEVETQTCENFRKLDAEPAGGLGTKIGRFAERDGSLRFVPETRG